MKCQGVIVIISVHTFLNMRKLLYGHTFYNFAIVEVNQILFGTETRKHSE